MTVVRRNTPFFPDWLDDFFTGDINPSAKSRVLTVPPVNVFETDTAYKIELAAPNLKKEDININLENDVLTISAEKEEDNISEEGQYTKKEFNYFNFSRSFTLPEIADREKIEAKSENGVLTITIHKKEDVIKKPKQIEIK
ncbi:MAG: Hsp20/alpha crystallin family protein [Bacteroidales bacterium]|nr:Hsp20/alpha crystallin family protein [Bacteroidales bacterium]